MSITAYILRQIERHPEATDLQGFDEIMQLFTAEIPSRQTRQAFTRNIERIKVEYADRKKVPKASAELGTLDDR